MSDLSKMTKAQLLALIETATADDAGDDSPAESKAPSLPSPIKVTLDRGSRKSQEVEFSVLRETTSTGGSAVYVVVGNRKVPAALVITMADALASPKSKGGKAMAALIDGARDCVAAQSDDDRWTATLA